MGMRADTATTFNPREALIPLVVFTVALATILGAWGFEKIGGYVPCALCLQERIPYYIGVPVALLAVIAAFAGARPIVVRGLLLLAALIFAANVVLGVYHAGAEWALWQGPTDCGQGGGTVPTNTGDLLSQLGSVRIVSCTEASFRFLFLSFAGWNALVSLFLVVLCLAGAFGLHTRLLPRSLR